MNRQLFIDEVTRMYYQYVPGDFIQHLADYVKEMPLDRRHMGGEPAVSVEKVVGLCCMYFNVSLEDMIARPRHEDKVYMRKVTMYLLRTRTRMRPCRIAEMFKRDHTSVAYSIHSLRQIMSVEADVREEVLRLSAQL